MGATVIVDAFWGDSGKGKIGAYVAARDQVDFCVRAGTGTNAGHSLYLDGDKRIAVNQMPLSGIQTTAELRVGSGVALDPRKLIREMDDYESCYNLKQRTKVDYRCPVVLPEYIAREQADVHLRDRVGSTGTGTGVALAEFRLRRAIQAKDCPELRPFCCDVATELNRACAAGKQVVVEGSQGTFLSLALTADYPFCTSDNCTTAAFVDDVGLNWQYIDDVVLVVKTIPSRIGSGPLPSEMSIAEQDRRGIREYGVTTGRRRRKASQISWEHLQQAVMLNGPTQIALTFCDHFDPDIRDQRQLSPRVRALIKKIERVADTPVTIVETGKRFDSIFEPARQ